MRASIILIAILLAMGFLAFAVNNLGTSVGVTLLSETDQYPLYGVVGFALIVGVVATSTIAIAEGARTRLDNRRLRKELHRLETELNFLRTQPSTLPPDRESERPAALPMRANVPPPLMPLEGPVYEAEGADLSGTDDDDEVYSGA